MGSPQRLRSGAESTVGLQDNELWLSISNITASDVTRAPPSLTSAVYKAARDKNSVINNFSNMYSEMGCLGGII